jgi:hypothetical protein
MTAGNRLHITLPEGWRGASTPPPGTLLAAVNLNAANPASIVVTQMPLPPLERNLAERVEQHAAAVISQLEQLLTDFELVDVWSTSEFATGPTSQRFSFEHTTNNQRCAVAQDHHWADEIVFVATATVSEFATPDLVEAIEESLASVIVDSGI